METFCISGVSPDVCCGVRATVDVTGLLQGVTVLVCCGVVAITFTVPFTGLLQGVTVVLGASDLGTSEISATVIVTEPPELEVISETEGSSAGSRCSPSWSVEASDLAGDPCSDMA